MARKGCATPTNDAPWRRADAGAVRRFWPGHTAALGCPLFGALGQKGGGGEGELTSADLMVSNNRASSATTSWARVAKRLGRGKQLGGESSVLHWVIPPTRLGARHRT
jgi:hypothetical protein